MKTKQAKPVQPPLYDGPLEPLLTIPDVVKLLQVSRRTVYTLIDQGLPTMKFGKSVRVHPADFRRWLARSGRVA
jgi:excisionase family DNA binding protein